MSISNFSNYIVICRKGIAICKANLVSPSSSQIAICCTHRVTVKCVCGQWSGQPTWSIHLTFPGIDCLSVSTNWWNFLAGGTLAVVVGTSLDHSSDELNYGYRYHIFHWTVASQKYADPWKCAHPPFSPKVIAKGHLLLKSRPTQQTKIICSSMHSDEIHSVHVCVG